MKRWEDVRHQITVFNEDEKEEMDFVVYLISKIIERRNELGLSQRELAEITGIKQPAIARIESFRTTPNVSTLYKLLKSLNLRIQVTSD